MVQPVTTPFHVHVLALGSRCSSLGLNSAVEEALEETARLFRVTLVPVLSVDCCDAESRNIAFELGKRRSVSDIGYSSSQTYPFHVAEGDR